MIFKLESIVKKQGTNKLFDNTTIVVKKNEKIGIVGKNGSGKSTLLKVIVGTESLDSGKMVKNGDFTFSYLPQLDDYFEEDTVEHIITTTLSDAPKYEVDSIMNKFNVSFREKKIKNLSGGQRKRFSLACTLLKKSDLLILDEPTNHLDIDMIMFLERYLRNFKQTLLMVTHDRYFLDRICNKIIEVDRGKLYKYEGNYNYYVTTKSQRELESKATDRKRATLLKKEQEWLNQGVKARGTRSKKRLEEFYKLSDAKSFTDDKKLKINTVGSRLGSKTIEFKNVFMKFDDNTLIKDFTYDFARTSRIAIVGKNGTGKSTLLNIINGDLIPTQGTVVVGDTAKIGYYRQQNLDMPQDKRVFEFINEQCSTIETVDGSKGPIEMLDMFLFDKKDHHKFIKQLSGGEKKRLNLLAILLKSPNILLLDEPTNDLDIDTLTVLEEYLDIFIGIVIVVTHDRYFLDKVVDEIFELRSDGELKRHIGNFDMFFEKQESSKRENEKKTIVVRDKKTKLKLTYMEEKELASIDEEIEKLEQQLSLIDKEMSASSSDYSKLQEIIDKRSGVEKIYNDKNDRWVFLHEKLEEIENQKEG